MTTKLRKTNQQPHDKKDLNNFPGFPFDLIFDILLKLPVKSLLRFKCASKTWLNLISGPIFINSYREKSMKKNKNLVFWSQVDMGPIVWLDIKRNEIMKLWKFFWLELDLVYDVVYFKYICPLSCDIICFIGNDNRIGLLNPSTRKVKFLRKPSTSTLFYSKLGFVYSSRTKEYKVVHLFFRRFGDGSTSEGMDCETFTFGDELKVSSSSWIASKEQCPRCIYSNSVSTDGRIYWLIRHYAPAYKLTTNDLIVSFPSTRGSFKIIPKPSSWPLKNYKNFIELMAFEGNLCVVDVKIMLKKSVLDIWMFKENNCSWEQLYSVNLNGFGSICWANMLCPKFIFDGEVVFLHSAATAEDEKPNCTSCSGAAQIYNIEKKTFRSLPRMDYMGVFWESLSDF